jgi:uncharacterized cupredoxin-like copper-binding protein
VRGGDDAWPSTEAYGRRLRARSRPRRLTAKEAGIVGADDLDRSIPRRIMIRRFTVLATLAGVALALVTSATSAPTATVVNVTAGKPSELRFTLSKKSVAKGKVTFKVVNKGALDHDFKIAGKKTARLKAGKTATLTVTLKAGKAPYLCTVPGHAAGGMKGTLTVK